MELLAAILGTVVVGWLIVRTTRADREALARARRIEESERQGTQATLDAARQMQQQALAMLIGQTDWLTRMTETGVVKVQGLAEQLAARGGGGPRGDLAPSPQRDYGFDLEREADEEEERDEAARRGGLAGRMPPLEAEGSTPVDELVRTLEQELRYGGTHNGNGDGSGADDDET